MTSRKFQLEALEPRQMLAGDVIGNAWHNQDQPADVNGDGEISPLDALLVANALGTMETFPAVNATQLSLDVDNNQLLTPLDALLVINQLSRDSLEGESGSPVASQFFTDVNGDRKTSAIDALQVINYLTRASNSQLLAELEPTGTDLGSSSSDEVFAVLDGDDPDTIASYASDVPSRSSSADLGGNSGTTDDDEDDVLVLLADDVSGVWS